MESSSPSATTSQAAITARAVGIDYTVNGDKHRTYLSYGLGVCVTAPSKPLERTPHPEPLTPEEIDE